MDPALLREREAFKRRAMAQPTVENKKAKTAQSESKTPKSAKKDKQSAPQSQSAKAKLDMAKAKSLTSGSSQFKFGVLARIVRHMKVRIKTEHSLWPS